MNRRTTGLLGEKLAKSFLQKKGYRILTINYRCRGGEIDIIASHKHVIVFIEVRAKTILDFGIPEESVTSIKKNRLIQTALTYLNLTDRMQAQWRIDFIALELTAQGEIIRVNHIENAVTA